MIRAINFGCGQDLKYDTDEVEWFNVDLPEIDLDKFLPYDDDSFDFGFCRSVVPYLKDLKFSVGEMMRVCKVLKVQFPHFIGSPNPISYGKVFYHGFTIRDLLLLKPYLVRVEFYNYFLFKGFSFNPLVRWQCKLAFVYDIYFSSLFRCRGVWLSFNRGVVEQR